MTTIITLGLFLLALYVILWTLGAVSEMVTELWSSEAALTVVFGLVLIGIMLLWASC